MTEDNKDELKKLQNEINNLTELLNTANTQIFECCKALGVDTDKEIGDGWTLYAKCKEVITELNSLKNK